MEKNTDSKRKSRNLSEKKRRDQFNNLINELNNLIDPHFNQNQNDVGEDDDACSSSGARQRKMDKSSVLKCAMEFLRKHSNAQQQQQPDEQTQSICKTNSQFNSNNSDNSTGFACESGAGDLLDKSQWKPSYITDDEFSVQMLESLDAFILVCEVTSEARIIYSSDTLTNLLSYSGTCNSLRHYDYVSMFDLVSQNDRQQLEKLFADESEDLDSKITNQENSHYANRYGGKYPPMEHQNQQAMAHNNSFEVKSADCQAAAQAKRDNLMPPSDVGYKSLVVNFRSGLNLTEIKQKHLKQKGVVVLRPSSQNQSYSLDADQYQPSAAMASAQQSLHQQVQLEKQQQQQLHQHHQRQPQSGLPQQTTNSSPMQTDGASSFYMETVDEQEKACGQGQHSIAEQQKQLISEGHREQQEQNQHRQQLHRNQHVGQQQQQEQQLVELLQIDKQTNDENQMSDGSNENNSGDDGLQQTSSSSDSASATNSDENDQPSSTGSDDASESNQSQSVTGERKHQYRHHHHHHHHHHHNHSHHHHKQQHNQQHRHHHHHHHHHHVTSGGGGHTNSKHSTLQHQRRQKPTNSSNGQQYELVRLMGIVKSFGDSSVNNSLDLATDDNGELFEQQTTARGSRKRYFICIGRLDTPRLSYDLKMIAPPMTSGTNVFHNNQFLSKHTLKWRFLWVDNRAPAIIGYLPFEVLGTSGYDYYHWDDLDKLVSSHEGLMRDGQGCSGPYRFLTKGQQWIWLQTKYCIILKPQCYSRSIAAATAAATAANQKKLKLSTQNNNGDQQVQQQQSIYQPQMEHKQDSMSTYGDGGVLSYASQQQYNYENQPDYQSQMQTDNNYLSTTMMSYANPNQMGYRQDVQMDQFAASQQEQQQQQQYDYGQVTYSRRSGDSESGPKRFRSDQYDSVPAAQKSSSNNHDQGSLEEEEDDQDNEDEDGQEQQQQKQQQQLFCDQQQNEQRRYEKLLKSNDLIKKQSIEAGNSFLSRSLDQFKFILCTHTVIGFDESDSLSVGEANSATSAAAASSSSSLSSPIKAKMIDQQHHQQQQQQKTFGVQSRGDHKREQLQLQQSKSQQSAPVGAFQQQRQKSQ